MQSNTQHERLDASQTPITIKPRRMNFPYQDMDSRAFFDNNVLKSAYVAALSSTFPGGEGEFIKSVRMFRDQTDDPELKEQIKGFIGQEAFHSQQHQDFNQSLKPLGFDVPRAEKVFEKDLESSVSQRTPEQRLAITVCMEHMTAIMAEAFLENDYLLKGMHPTIAQLLRWHSVEEIEHKSVAFDLFMDTVGKQKMLHKVMWRATILLNARTTKYMLLMLWWEKKMPSWKDIKGFYSFMFGKQGLLRSVKAAYKDFFRDDFHPWDHKNQHLIDEWKEQHYQPRFDRNSNDFEQAAA